VTVGLELAQYLPTYQRRRKHNLPSPLVGEVTMEQKINSSISVNAAADFIALGWSVSHCALLSSLWGDVAICAEASIGPNVQPHIP